MECQPPCFTDGSESHEVAVRMLAGAGDPLPTWLTHMAINAGRDEGPWFFLT